MWEHPVCLPCSLTHLWAVVMMASTTSMILCSAESVPMVMSVPQKSLSMEPTMPTMWSSELLREASSLIRPERVMKTNENCVCSVKTECAVHRCRPRHLCSGAHPAGRSTPLGTGWRPSGCRPHQSHTGWWCCAAPGWAPLWAGPRGCGTLYSGHYRWRCHPDRRHRQTTINVIMRSFFCNINHGGFVWVFLHRQ